MLSENTETLHTLTHMIRNYLDLDYGDNGRVEVRRYSEKCWEVIAWYGDEGRGIIVSPYVTLDEIMSKVNEALRFMAMSSLDDLISELF